MFGTVEKAGGRWVKQHLQHPSSVRTTILRSTSYILVEGLQYAARRAREAIVMERLHLLLLIRHPHEFIEHGHGLHHRHHHHHHLSTRAEATSPYLEASSASFGEEKEVLPAVELEMQSVAVAVVLSGSTEDERAILRARNRRLLVAELALDARLVEDQRV